MERFLLFIKHRLGFLWRVIESGNALAFRLTSGRKQRKILAGVLGEIDHTGCLYRELAREHMEALHRMIQSQPESDLDYFRPHGFDTRSLLRQFRNPSFLMMGAFDGDELAGYFFLRFFANRKCFVGRLVDRDHRGAGIGPVMNTIMYETAWRMGFRCLSTISRNNRAVMNAHSKNRAMVVLKELKDNYLLVEFKRPEEEAL